MFGIGGGELVVILVVVLFAVGPDRMPTLLKAVGKGIREMRRAARELQSTVGIDELMGDEDFRDPLGLKKPIAPKPMAEPPSPAAAPIVRRGIASLSEEDLAREQPHEGVDLAHAEAEAVRQAAEAEA
ncbi:MAG: twin-arginine translocase TatA/TatE family subunit [Polyangiales bacterium]